MVGCGGRRETPSAGVLPAGSATAAFSLTYNKSLQSCRPLVPQRNVRGPRPTVGTVPSVAQGPSPGPFPASGTAARCRGRPKSCSPAQAGPRRGRVPIGIAGLAGCGLSGQELASREQSRPRCGESQVGKEGGASQAEWPAAARGAARGCVLWSGARVGGRDRAGGVFRGRESAAGRWRWVRTACFPPAHPGRRQRLGAWVPLGARSRLRAGLAAAPARSRAVSSCS